MKKLFSNRVFAVCLTVVLMIVSVLMNTHVKLGKKCEILAGTFYAEDSISGGLTRFCDAVEELVSLGQRCQISGADAPTDQVEEIRGMLSQRSGKYGVLYQDYETLLRETFSLESSLEQILSQLNSEDADRFTVARHNAAEAKASVDGCDYNVNAAMFLKSNSHFPTPQLAACAGVSLPELFA